MCPTSNKHDQSVDGGTLELVNLSAAAQGGFRVEITAIRLFLSTVHQWSGFERPLKDPTT
jgi:hypothetical protein